MLKFEIKNKKLEGKRRKIQNFGESFSGLQSLSGRFLKKEQFFCFFLT